MRNKFWLYISFPVQLKDHKLNIEELKLTLGYHTNVMIFVENNVAHVFITNREIWKKLAEVYQNREMAKLFYTNQFSSFFGKMPKKEENEDWNIPL